MEMNALGRPKKQTQFPQGQAFEGNSPQGEPFDFAFLDLVRLRSRQAVLIDY